ncbi:MAG TPA: hypothetical protein VF994_11915 [Myxococcales bacterium]
MLPLARIGLSRSTRAAFRAAVVVLAWLALWFSALIATLERPHPRQAEVRIHAVAATRARGHGSEARPRVLC